MSYMTEQDLGPIEIDGEMFAPTEEIGGIVIARKVPHASPESQSEPELEPPITNNRSMSPRKFRPATFDCVLPSLERNVDESAQIDPSMQEKPAWWTPQRQELLNSGNWRIEKRTIDPNAPRFPMFANSLHHVWWTEEIDGKTETRMCVELSDTELLVPFPPKPTTEQPR